jgi:3,4-dihydroxy 2-butanone 4-phosphate synthase / GTP cyclohydrolase II
MMWGARLHAFAAEHGLPVLATADLVRYPRSTGRLVEHVATALMPTVAGDFRATAFRSTLDATEHLAMVLGDVARAGAPVAGVLVRVHSECLRGDMVGLLRCGCGPAGARRSRGSRRRAAARWCTCAGTMAGDRSLPRYPRNALQEDGLDTVDADTTQRLPVECRNYGVGAQILG